MSSSLASADAHASSSSSTSLFDSFSSALSTIFPRAQADEGDDDEEGGGDKEESGDDKEEGGDGKEEGGDEEGGEDKEDGGDDEGGDDGGDDDDDDDEPEDSMPAIYEQCENSRECAPLKHHFLECQERVEAGKGFKDENCVEEFFHLAHCASDCTAPRLFKGLK